MRPRVTEPSFADKLTSAARQFGWEKSDRLETHRFRRIAVRSILKAGGSFAYLLEAG